MSLNFIEHQNNILNSFKLIQSYIHKTPLLQSATLNKLYDNFMYFKCENFQKTGSFKIRGATSAFLNEFFKSSYKSLATHSSGNFAQAVAYIASLHNIPAFIVMPNNAIPQKVESVRSLNANIIFCEPTIEAREKTLSEITNGIETLKLHPFDSWSTIYGQATIAIELFNQIDKTPDIILVPVGGGGLISGIAIWTKINSPNTKVIGVEPENVNDAWLSFKYKKRFFASNKYTIADGLRASIGQIPFEIILHLVDDIFLVKEESIIESMYLIFERLKIVIEPSAAVSFAAIVEYPNLFLHKNIVIILSGGNVNLKNLPWNH